MRHNKKFNHLGRTKAHRDAMLSNMATSLILHKRIFTTLAKAKALRASDQSRKRRYYRFSSCSFPLFAEQRGCYRIVQRNFGEDSRSSRRVYPYLEDR